LDGNCPCLKDVYDYEETSEVENQQKLRVKREYCCWMSSSLIKTCPCPGKNAMLQAMRVAGKETSKVVNQLRMSSSGKCCMQSGIMFCPCRGAAEKN